MSPRDPELTRLLIGELERHLVALEAASEEGDPDLERSRRSVHALKGSAGLAGEPELASSMQRLERRLREGDHDALVEIIATIKNAIARLSAGDSAAFVEWPEPPLDLGLRTLDPLVRTQYVAEVTDRLSKIDDALGTTVDPVDAAAALYRHIHTMKGAASAAGDEAMAWFCHGLEDKIRAGPSSPSAAASAIESVAKYRAVLAGLLEDPEAALATLRGAHRSRTARPPQRPSAWPDDDVRVPEGDFTIRVPAKAVDRALDHIGRITVARDRVAARAPRASAQAKLLRRLRGDLADALRLIGPPRPWGAPAAALRRIESTAQALAEMGEDLDTVSEQLKQSEQTLRDETGAAKKLLAAMRQTSMRVMFDRLGAAALAEARRSGRLVNVRTSGAEETIDRRLAEQLLEPCLQLTRNAIAHGIEEPSLRESLGKPEAATLTLTARRSANRLTISIADDGAGVDIAAMRSRAVEAGVVTDVLAEAADDQTLLELLFLPGFSTRQQSPDLLAGRGIGLDITLVSIQKLGGTIRLSSRYGHGFEARLDLPVETGVVSVLWVRAAGLEHALPAAHVRRVGFNDGPDADRILHLAACLDPRPLERAPVVVDLDVGLDRPEHLLLGVDAALATEEVLVRPLSPLLWQLGPYAGAIVRGDGSLCLALDVHGLAPRARALVRVPEGRVSDVPSRPPPTR